MTLSCTAKKDFAKYNEETKTVTFVDSIKGSTYTFNQGDSKDKLVVLVFRERFRDSVETYLNNKIVDRFYKDDHHYDKDGIEYKSSHSQPKEYFKILEIKNSTVRNNITIFLENADKKVSFEIIDGYDVYVISHYQTHWHVVGTKAKFK